MEDVKYRKKLHFDEVGNAELLYILEQGTN